MKILVAPSENPGEKRVAITPDIASKLIKDGHQVQVIAGTGVNAGFSDNEYESVLEEVPTDVDVVISVSPTRPEILAKLSNNCKLICLGKSETLNAFERYSLEMVPRISRAQNMDVLSSQANLVGYKAVIEAAALYPKAFPLMMTAAGTIAPAKVLILGAGVAGLQAIATARRLGAVVSAYDVRSVVKEQVESLGAKFIDVGIEASGTGGYAKELDQEEQDKQQKALLDVMSKQDIIITTAQIPGRKAPLLITKDMLGHFKKGTIIMDLAVESGGNVFGSVLNEIVENNGIKIVGYGNFASRIARDASILFAKNIYNFLQILLKDPNDEIVQACKSQGVEK